MLTYSAKALARYGLMLCSKNCSSTLQSLQRQHIAQAKFAVATMAHPNTCFPVKLVQAATDSWESTFIGCPWRGFRHEEIMALVDFYFSLEGGEKGSFLGFIRDTSQPLWMAMIVQIAEKILGHHERFEGDYDNVIELLRLYMVQETNHWLCTMSLNQEMPGQ